MMLKPRDLLPTKKETRRVFIGVCVGLLVAGIVGAVGLALPRVRGWLGARSEDLLEFASHDVLIRGWVVVALTLCALLAVIQLFRWLAFALGSPHVRLFRSLSRNEQAIVRLLARSDYGLTEGELSTLVPVSAQCFLHFIDRLVHDLRLAERTEPASGGAFWALSAKGREIATANHLFSNDLPTT